MTTKRLREAKKVWQEAKFSKDEDTLADALRELNEAEVEAMELSKKEAVKNGGFRQKI